MTTPLPETFPSARSASTSPSQAISVPTSKKPAGRFTEAFRTFNTNLLRRIHHDLEVATNAQYFDPATYPWTLYPDTEFTCSFALPNPDHKIGFHAYMQHLTDLFTADPSMTVKVLDINVNFIEAKGLRTCANVFINEQVSGFGEDGVVRRSVAMGNWRMMANGDWMCFGWKELGEMGDELGF